jgi:hypothetical protein
MRILLVIASAAVLAATPAVAQDQSRVPAFYQVRFTIHDNGDPAATGVRSYLIVAAANRKAVFTAGERVPVANASYDAASRPNAPTTQFTYIDLGVNIECTVSEAGGKLRLEGSMNISALARRDARQGASGNPSIVQTKLSLNAAVDPGKPVIIAAIDDPLDSHKLEIEAAVTKLQ